MPDQSIQKTDLSPEILSNLVLKGDISGLSPQQKVEYNNALCARLGLDPATQPFAILRLQGKEILYAKRELTEQLRKIHGVSITQLDNLTVNDVYIVKATAKDNSGRTDCSTGAVTIGSLKGDALANALMKAETKAKRRVTLSICGLGMLDETEIETIPNAQTVSPTDSPEKKQEDAQITWDILASTLEDARHEGTVEALDDWAKHHKNQIDSLGKNQKEILRKSFAACKKEAMKANEVAI